MTWHAQYIVQVTMLRVVNHWFFGLIFNVPCTTSGRHIHQLSDGKPSTYPWYALWRINLDLNILSAGRFLPQNIDFETENMHRLPKYVPFRLQRPRETITMLLCTASTGLVPRSLASLGLIMWQRYLTTNGWRLLQCNDRSDDDYLVIPGESLIKKKWRKISSD